MEPLLLALTILSSSFFGSWHCAAMCGPVASVLSQRGSLVPYHLGRLISYITLGLLAGALGQFFLNSDFIFIRWVAAYLLAGLLILAGLKSLAPEKYLLRFESNKISHFFLKAIRKLQAFHLNKSNFIVGLLTAFLPCGWLYTYVMAAIATKSALGGGMVMLLFGLGGIPAISALPLMVRSAVSKAGLQQKRIAGIILILAGLYSIFSFYLLNH